MINTDGSFTARLTFNETSPVFPIESILVDHNHSFDIHLVAQSATLINPEETLI